MLGVASTSANAAVHGRVGSEGRHPTGQPFLPCRTCATPRTAQATAVPDGSATGHAQQSTFFAARHAPLGAERATGIFDREPDGHASQSTIPLRDIGRMVSARSGRWVVATTSCSACGRMVGRSAGSRPDPVCQDCRRVRREALLAGTVVCRVCGASFERLQAAQTLCSLRCVHRAGAKAANAVRWPARATP